jgi:L,D-peptidoglycan transpeptidase YkuD (ErfK/YbiS/YcfS/YnhG family)
VILSRRAFVVLPLMFPGRPRPRPARSSPADLAYAAGRLSWPGGSVGKREGDGATPSGTYALLFGLYRADRLLRPPSVLAMTVIEPDHIWIDDPADANYNRLESLPYPAHAERLWREDELYDLLVVIGYNIDPTMPGAGSAIFLHVARPDFSPTEGCIAVAKDALIGVVGLLGPGSAIHIGA